MIVTDKNIKFEIYEMVKRSDGGQSGKSILKTNDFSKFDEMVNQLSISKTEAHTIHCWILTNIQGKEYLEFWLNEYFENGMRDYVIGLNLEAEKSKKVS